MAIELESVRRAAGWDVQPENIEASVLPTFGLNPLLSNQQGEFRGADIRSLLDFRSSYVPNLYSFDENSSRFRFDHREYDVVSRCEGTVNGKKQVSFKYVNSPFVKFGIGYLGYIQVKNNRQKHSLGLLGERSFDPMGENYALTPEDAKYYMKILISAFKAAVEGADTDLVKQISKVMKPNERYHPKSLLREFAIHQVLNSVYENKNPKDYGCFILKKVKQGKIKLHPRKNRPLITYLEQLISVKGQTTDSGLQVFPTQNYFVEIWNNYADEYLIEELGNEAYSVVEAIAERKECFRHTKINHTKQYLETEERVESDFLISTGVNMQKLRERVSMLEQNYSYQLQLSFRRRGRVPEITDSKTPCTIF